MIEQCVYIEGSRSIYDFVRNGKMMYSDQPLEQVLQEQRDKGKNPMVISVSEGIDRSSQACHDHYWFPPRRVSQERYNDMLEVLPPIGWGATSGGECFKMREMLYGNVTAIFCSMPEGYFELIGEANLTPKEIVKLVRESEAFSQA